MRQKKGFSGFTLVELMITLAIFSLLVSLAYPSYTGFVARSKRAAAKTELMRIVQIQERYYIDQRTYGKLSDLGFAADTIGIDDNGRVVASGAGIYDITITPAPTATTFTVQATAKNSQTKDTGCTTLSVTAAGVSSPASCWK